MENETEEVIRKDGYCEYVELMRIKKFSSEFGDVAKDYIKIKNNEIILTCPKENIITIMGAIQNEYRVSYDVYMKLYSLDSEEVDGHELIGIVVYGASDIKKYKVRFPYFQFRERLFKWNLGVHLNSDEQLRFVLDKNIKIDDKKSEIFIEADVWSKQLPDKRK